MVEVFRKDRIALLVVILFVIFTGWWAYIQFILKEENKLLSDLFTSTYGVMALIGGIAGVRISMKWGFIRSILGRAIFVLSLGLLFQELGQLMYTYYIYYLKIEVPYPSLGDIGYFGSVILYAYGVLLIAKASGVRFTLKNVESKIQAVIVPLVILTGAYVLFLMGNSPDFANPIKLLLDFGYPLGEAFYISVALLTYLLTRGVLGGVMRSSILFLLFALLVQFVSDFTFLYQVSREAWTISGINDYMFLCAYFLMTIGILRLNHIYDKLRE